MAQLSEVVCLPQSRSEDMYEILWLYLFLACSTYRFCGRCFYLNFADAELAFHFSEIQEFSALCDHMMTFSI